MPLTWFLLLRRGYFEGLFIGFLITLIMSDSLEESMVFAAKIKPVYLLFLSFTLFTFRHKIVPRLNIFFAFIPFFLVASIALIWSETIGVGIQKTVSYILLYIVVPSFAFYFLNNSKDFLRHLNYVTIGVLSLSLIFYVIVPDIGASHGERLRGIFGNPNGLGLYIIVSFLFYQFTNWRFKRQFSPKEHWLILGLFFMATILSGSRNALLSILIFYVFIFTFKRFRYLGIILSVILIPVINYAAFNAVEIIQALSLQEFFRVETLVEGSGRLIAWQFAWEHIQDYFFVGRGISFDEYLMRSNAVHLARLGHEGGVHNTYLILWLNSGLIGLFSFISAMFYLFFKAFKFDVLAAPILLTVLFCISFEPWLAASLNPYTSVYLIVLTGLLATGLEYEKTEELDASDK